MKAISINGEIKVYDELPAFWKNYLNFSQAPIELQQQEGFFDVVQPEYDLQLQELGELYFDEENNVFTYPINEKVFDLDEIKNKLLDEFDVVLNEFATIIARCRFTQDEPYPQGLLDAIAQAKQIRINTIAAINNLSTIEEALHFRIRQEDVAALKELFKPYM